MQGSFLDHYITEIEAHPLLTREEEVALGHLVLAGDAAAHDRLVISNLRFVVKIAHEYMGYGLKLLDLIQEGNLGLIRAVQKFDVNRGYRLISYAVWWIRAYIQNFILRSWSLVKLGTTRAQRKLFFKLRAAADAVGTGIDALGATDAAHAIAETLDVKFAEVVNMQTRLSVRDAGLDDMLTAPSNQRYVAQAADAVTALMASQRQIELTEAIYECGPFTEIERYIIKYRLMSENPETLKTVGLKFSRSRESIRKLEISLVARLRARLSEFKGA